MSNAKVISLVLIVLFLTGVSVNAATIHESLQVKLDQLNAGETVEAIAFFNHQADIVSLNQQLKQKRATLAERNRRVIIELQEAATQTQPVMAAYLEKLKARDIVKNYRMFWIANIFYVEASREGIEALATHRDLDILYANIPIELIEPVEYDSDEGLLLGHEIGLERINALAAWEHGWTGEGRVVMNIDTGVDGTHPALSERFRGDVDGDGDYDESWLDPYDTHWEFPQDGASHGTHTMGTICGRSVSGDTIGVAIDAQWIASAAIDRGGIDRTIQDILISFEWAVDPDGDPETQDNPDAIGNSWGIPDNIGWEDCDQTFWQVIDNVEAAGSVVIFSAGNEGYNGLRSPPDRAETFYNVFSVGAVDGNDPNLPIASWSARGPTECARNELAIKPEVVAPGVGVRSSVPGGGYTTMSGTSMASPHVTGAVAVMRQANPNLDVDTIKDILMSTAHDLPFDNPDGEDNDFGHGVIDLYEACLLAQAGYGFIEGRVTDIYDIGIGDALIRVIDSETSTNTGEYGYYEIALLGDTTYTIEASFFGYLSEQVEIDLAIEETLVVDFVLQEAIPGNLHGTVVSAEDASPIAGANIEVVDTPVEPTQSDDNGYYEFAALPGDITYIIRVRASGFGMGENSILVPGGGEAELNFALGSFESFENDDGNWVGEGVWEWGEPTSGPGAAFDGFNVWATVLDGDYVNNADDLLISNFVAVDDDQAILRFYHWYDFEHDGTSARDGGNVSVRILGDNLWELITPAGGYPADQVRGLDNEPGYSGSSDDWIQAEFDLGDYEGSIIQLCFRMGANGSNTREGWYIDSVDVSGAALLPLPDIEVDPAFFAVELQSGQSADRTLSIANPTDGVLTFEIRPMVVYRRLGFHDDSTPSDITGSLNRYDDRDYVYSSNGDFLTVTYSGPKHDVREPDPDPPMILDSGGPDEFGYTWIDSDEPDGPVYEWIEISGDGQPLQFDNDQNQGPMDLGFGIPFYGDYYGSIRICSNGWISFTSNATESYNRPIPNDIEPNNLVAPFWDNLNPENGGEVYFYTNNTDSAIVEWQDVPRYFNSGSFTFEVILTADGNITYQYNSLDGVLNSCTIGIENGGGTVGLQIAYNQNYVAENLAVKIEHPTIWLSADPLSGFVMPGSSSDINVTFDATQLEEGEYVGYLDIISNDPDEGSMAVECTLTVSGETGLGDLSGVIPEKFELQQNYPNPFNPTTRITFALPVQSAVRLIIYDLLGRQVRGLLAEELPAGYHAVSWDGTNDKGRAVSSGIYFYQLEAGDFEQSRKMIMLK